MALYSEKVMDHFLHPRNVGVIEDADGVGEVGNAKCGDIMKIFLKIDDGVVTDAKFSTFGCGSAIASSSMATEMIKGQPLEKVMELTNKAVVEALDGLPAYKLHCSVLAEEAVKAALKDYFDKTASPTTRPSSPRPPAAPPAKCTDIKTRAINTARHGRPCFCSPSGESRHPLRRDAPAPSSLRGRGAFVGVWRTVQGMGKASPSGHVRSPFLWKEIFQTIRARPCGNHATLHEKKPSFLQ